MRWLRILAHVLVLLFWGLVLSTLLYPLSQPFAGLLQLSGAFMVILNTLAVLLHPGLLAQQRSPWRKRVLVLLFGSLQLPVPAEVDRQAGVV